MSNSRSQTKIRKTQQVNLLAEQRYFRQKNLLFENIEEFQECFDSFGLTNEKKYASTLILEQGDSFHVPVGLRHQMLGLEETELFEFSTQHFEADSIRVEKGD